MQPFEYDVFIGGVIQGSERGRSIAPQDYRTRIRAAVEAGRPGATVYDPVACHPSSIDYGLERARQTFFGHAALAARCRAFIAYLPEASTVSYTHLRAHETVLDLVCRLLLEKKKERK